MLPIILLVLSSCPSIFGTYFKPDSIETQIHIFNESSSKPSNNDFYFHQRIYSLKSRSVKHLSQCSSVKVDMRQNCAPLNDINEITCLSINCCWDERFKESIVPPCYFPRDTTRYKVVAINESDSGIEGILVLQSYSGLPAVIKYLKVTVSYCSETLLRLKITDLERDRFEVPFSYDSCSPHAVSAIYQVEFFSNGTFGIKRKQSGITIFSTDFSTLLYADQILQISSTLPSHYIYGLGDHMGPLLRSTNWTKYTFFNRDEIPKHNMNLYSSFPFYMVMENDGSSHGVYLFNSNAMDVILQPAPSITFRTIGGILDFFIFLGPSPNDVVRDFTKFVGNPAMPPYWSLGFHLCRLGYFSLNKTIEVVARTRNAHIPFDTQWNDIDYMKNYNDFTYDDENFKGLPEFISYLHEIGMHYVMIVDPGISSAEKPGAYGPFDDGIDMDIFIKNATGQLLKTKVWNKISSVFPDFSHPLAEEYWQKQLLKFHSVIPFDGVWLDMNEPTNFLNGSFDGCPENSSLEKPPYVPGKDALSTKTICMTAQHDGSLHYNLHNIYGTLETMATYKAMVNIRGKRPFVLTRAGFPGIGKFAAMWNGDVISIWEHMKLSIPSILSYGMAGVPNIGADICGFNDNTTIELCARWFALGAFYPFCRNHNSDENIEQDPVALGPIVTASAVSALNARYFLLPYLYTLMFRSHTEGESVAKPLFFEFPNDVYSYQIDTQFLWGPALMIIPALEPGVRQVSGYLPPDTWYDFYTGMKIVSKGENFIFDAPLDKINLVVRGGNVLPCQVPGVTTTMSRENIFVLLIALNSTGESLGYLYWDDGDALDIDETQIYNLLYFSVAEGRLQSKLLNLFYITDMILGNVYVFGLNKAPSTVLVNGNPSTFIYKNKTEVLEIIDISVSLLKPLVIEW